MLALIGRNRHRAPADTGAMTDSIARRESGACRLPGDDPEPDDASRPSPSTAGQSEKPRQACMVDIDWNETSPHEGPAFGPPAPPASPAAPPPAVRVPQATSNATRTTERDLASGAYASAGYAPGGHAAYVGAAIVKGRDANGGEVEAMSASVQAGAQREAQVTVLRVGFSDSRVAVSGEAGTANAHVGIHNPDGSTGVNSGVGAVIVAAEGTFGDQANSLTVGIGVGVGAEASVGLRDKDGNGQPELCVRIGVKFATVGACVELPFHGKM